MRYKATTFRRGTCDRGPTIKLEANGLTEFVAKVRTRGLVAVEVWWWNVNRWWCMPRSIVEEEIKKRR